MAFGDIILGDGVFAITTTSGATAVDVGLTRGGGQFTVEREFRDILADGDFGPVVGRVREVSHVPKLTIRGLELLRTNITSFYPGSTMSAASTNWSGVLDTLSSSAPLFAVTWTGKTVSGTSVVVTVNNALNRENIDWALIDKEEVLPELVFTGHYGSTTRTTPPWSVVFTT
jgi:hypothetical protein